HQGPLAFADGSEQVHYAGGDVVGRVFQGEPLVGEDGGHAVEVEPFRRLLGIDAVDGLDAQQGDVALVVLGVTGLTGNQVPGPQVEAPDLGRRDVDVLLGGQVVARTEEAVAFGRDVQDALAEQVAVLFGFRLYDLEDEFFLAEAVIARQIELPGDLVRLLQRFAFKLGHFQAASHLDISWPRERDCETDDTDADAGHQLPCFWASRQSRRKRSNPLSVSGCWIMRCNTPKGMVATWAPAKAAWVTWSGWRMLAASTCVSILCKSKICTHWATTSMPSWLMSSRRPTKGLTKAAPARAANRA